jgi:hypothetical protein
MVTAAESIPLKTECTGTFPHEHCQWRKPKPTSRSCSRTSRRRPAPHQHGATVPRCHGAMVPRHHDTSATAPAQWHSTAQAVPLRDYTHTVYRRRPGSSLAEQWKKVDLDWKSGSATASRTGGFLQPADRAPNVWAKPGGREEGGGMNEPRGLCGGSLYSGKG